MNGTQFKALMAAADLSVRDAAAFLEVDPATIQRWRTAPSDRSPIPAWVVERLRARVAELAGPPPSPNEEG